MRHTIAHNLAKSQVRTACLAAFADYVERYAKYQPTVAWEGDHRAHFSVHARGTTLRGVLEVQEGALLVEVEVPLFLRPFQSKAISVVEAEAQKWLAQARAGAFD